jgi:hypothetical protein
MIRGASVIFIGQDREKLIFTDDSEDQIMHRTEAEEV